jgi:hypothetical protein
MMGFMGKAVYLDADMLVLGDIAELQAWPTPSGYTCCHPARTDTSVIDCSWFRDKQWWPSIEQMKPSGWRVFEYMQLLNAKGGVSTTLSWDWNCCDSSDNRKASTKLLHFTAVPWQPYKPYETVNYQPHPKPDWAKAWFDAKEEADAALA